MKEQSLHLGLIFVLCFFLFFSGLGSVQFYDKGEPREGGVVSAIYDTGNWILPLRNGYIIPSKPPLFHWLGSLVSESVGTVNEFTVRLPSALLGTAGVLLTYWAGATFWNPAVGLIAALVLATSFEWWYAAVSARVDMTLSFFLLCFFLFFYVFYRSGGGKEKALVLGVLLGLATLAKGPLGIVLASATVLIFLWLHRDLSFLRKTHPFIVLALAGAVAGSWYLLALWQGGNSFLHRVIYENVDSAVGIASHRKPFYYFIPGLFEGMAPWSLFLPAVGVFLYQQRHRLKEEGLLYFVVWFGVTFVFFSAAVGKRTVYILPLYPAVALIIGVWCHKPNDEPRSSNSWLARVAGIFIGASLVVVASILLLANPANIEHARGFFSPKAQLQLGLISDLAAAHRIAIFLWAITTGLGGIIAIMASYRRKWTVSFLAITMALAVSFSLLQNIFHPELSARYSFKNFMRRAALRVNDEPLFFCGMTDLGALFYAHRNIPPYDSRAISRGRPFYLLVWDRDWKDIADRNGLTALDISTTVDRAKDRHLMLVRASEGTRFDELVACNLAASKQDDDSDE